jgi:hypothetical protein
VALLGLKPVFVDVDPISFCMDIESLKKAITPKTKVIVPVHLYGHAAPMEEIMEIAKANNLFVIEDNAQAIGCDYTFSNGVTKKTGTIGHIGATSFYPSKNLGAFGDGGALCTNDKALADKMTMIANHGQSARYYHDVVGCNSILDSIQVAQNTIQGITEFCGIGDPNENIVAIEGFSFGSTGNRLAQLSGYQYVLRMHLLSKLISPVSIENMWIFAPATVKATAKAGGKGKGKLDMIQSFIEHEDKLPGLENNLFYQEICKNPETFQDKKGRFIKPVDDLIDSYFILKTYFKKSSLV